MFQFQIGAIRGRFRDAISRQNRRFNSKLVRLEGPSEIYPGSFVLSFQFQIGAIRGASWASALHAELKFQFQIGAIRGNLYAARQCTLLAFQFQIGAIRGPSVARTHSTSRGVSIPNWCD